MAANELFDPKTLIALLKKAGKEEFPFAFGVGKTPDKSVLVLHRKFGGKKLLKEIRNSDKDIKKGTFGMAKTDGKTLELKLEKKLDGAKSHVKKYLMASELKQNKLKLIEELAEAAEEEQEGEEAEAQEESQGSPGGASKKKKTKKKSSSGGASDESSGEEESADQAETITPERKEEMMKDMDDFDKEIEDFMREKNISV